jgi:hypothetical protein
VNLSTMRLFADTRLRPGSELPFTLAEDEGVLVYPLEGRVELVDVRAGATSDMAASGLSAASWGAASPAAGSVGPVYRGNPATLSAEGSTLPEGPREMAVAFGRPGGRAMRLLTPDGPSRVIRVVFASAEEDRLVLA